MGLALESIVSIEEKTLLAAHISMLLGRYSQAEQLFLKSSCPNEALAMRRDLLDWSKALALAEQLSPSEIPYISREYAQQLEFMEYLQRDVGKNIQVTPHQFQILEHNEVCRSGLARMSIRTGDIRKGIQLARDLHGRVVKRDCAIILEQLKQYGEAADLYEVGQFYDRAAAVCLKAKAWGKAYRNARDYDNLVRMLLDHLNMAEEAVKVVRESRSVEGAKLVAKMIISHTFQEAFQLAETTDHMAEYADAVEADGATQDQMAQLAEHFAGVGDAHNAGRFYLRAGHYRAALEYLMSCGENHDSLLLAIECVAAAGDNKLTARLTDFLMGEVDEIPKELVAKQIKVPYDMQNSLMIIHSYLIVKLVSYWLLLRVKNVQTAHRAAVQLMQPEYRQKIDAKYKKKIEAFVRKADKTKDPDETRPPCPHCAYPVPETDLACDNCKSTIPYCVITGRHIVDSDFAQCPSCHFPGYYSEFKKLLALDEPCPMCSSSLKDVIPADASAYLKNDKTNSEQLPS
ncbi:hypothetical protein GCK32_009890 [Trichostrongylus colubriformis]|uniref:IFT121-like zinc finger domain-containing protein n=1 Tax=Trichostrongylus colubriformis TaxID=6319 RepID=A0AAN8IYM4_TRICO